MEKPGRMSQCIAEYFPDNRNHWESSSKEYRLSLIHILLILKYYSFETYFFNPEIMAQLGIVESEEAFYETLYKKWREYLHRLTSGQKLIKALGRDFTSPEDMKDHMEEIRIHLRGHNLYDIFYGPFRSREQEILKAYIRLAPRDDFKDILDAIDSFPYFDSRKSGKQH